MGEWVVKLVELVLGFAVVFYAASSWLVSKHTDSKYSVLSSIKGQLIS